jgi:hypothetical protein
MQILNEDYNVEQSEWMAIKDGLTMELATMAMFESKGVAKDIPK